MELELDDWDELAMRTAVCRLPLQILHLQCARYCDYDFTTYKLILFDFTVRYYGRADSVVQYSLYMATVCIPVPYLYRVDSSRKTKG